VVGFPTIPVVYSPSFITTLVGHQLDKVSFARRTHLNASCINNLVEPHMLDDI